MAIRRPAIAIALLALAALPVALAPSGGVGAQTGSGPSFVRDAIAYTLDEGADGSGTAVAIGAPILVAGAISGGTDACAERASGEFRNPGADPASFIEAGDATATASSVLAVAADCAITYTGSAATRTAGTLEAYSLTVDVSDGVDADGNADASVDDTIKVTVKIVNAATDKLALEAFYDATGGDNWTVNTNWKSATLPAGCGDENRASGCWHAVNTDAAGRVTKLNFLFTGDVNSPNNFIGSLPAALGDLSRMTHFYIAARTFGVSERSHPELNHLLTGGIPAELGNLRSLTTLHFGGTNLSGEIPAEIGTLPALSELTLRDNRLTGGITDLSGLADTLTGLDLSGNLLSGGIPSWLGDMDLLETLDLQRNELSGAIPSALGDMDALDFLSLDGNRLDGALPDLSGLADTLTLLTLNGNELTGGIPDWLADMDTLRSLWLERNRLTGGIPNVLNGMDALESLILSNNPLSGTIPNLSGLADTLTLLWLGGNGLSGGIPDWLSGMDLLDDLRLHGNQLTGGIPDTLSDMDALRSLVLSDNPLGGAIPDLGELADTLQWLHLANTALSGRIPESMAALTNLSALELQGNPALQCVAHDDTAMLAWIDGIKAKRNGWASVTLCPPPWTVQSYGRIAITVAEEGDAPEGAAYALRLDCGASSFAPTLAAGESYTAPVVAGSVCSLSVTDGQGAREVRGEFAGRTIEAGAAPVTVTLVHAAPEPEPEPTAEEPRDQLERELVAGDAYLRWRGAETPVAEAVAGLTPRVNAVHWWDAATQAWRSWFPDGEALGANTLAMLDAGGIYVFVAE